MEYNLSIATLSGDAYYPPAWTLNFQVSYKGVTEMKGTQFLIKLSDAVCRFKICHSSTKPQERLHGFNMKPWTFTPRESNQLIRKATRITSYINTYSLPIAALCEDAD